MPQVPYSPIPQPGQMVATPKVSINTPEAAFGGTIGQAITAAGHQLDRAGDEVFKRAIAIQDLRNETDAKNADAKYMMESAKMMSEFKTLQGEQASPEALDKHIKSLDDLRTNIRGNLPNDAARRMYDSSSLSFMGRETINAAIHAAGQQKVAANQASVARVDLFRQDAFGNPKDDLSFKRAVNGSVSEIGAQAKIGGWSEVQKVDAINKTVSSLWAHRIQGLARTDPKTAQDMLEDRRGEIVGPDLERTENVVRNQIHSTGARVIADKVMDSANLEAVEGKPADSLESLLKRGDEIAKEHSPEDRQLADYVRNQIRSAYNTRQQSIKDVEYRNEDMILNALQQYKPTNLDQLKATSPQMEGLVNNMRPDKRLQLERRINSYNSALRKQGNEDEFDRFMGMQESPEGREELLNTHDLGKYGLSQPQMNKIMAVQKELRKDVNADPRVNRAIGQFRAARGSDLAALGIDRRTDQNKDDYDKFAGAMRRAIDTWVDVYKQQPKEKDIVETIGPNVIRTEIQKRQFWFDKTSDPMFKQPVPDDYSKIIKASPDWQELPQGEQTDSRLKDVYNRLIFKKLFESKIKKDQGKVGE